MLHDRPSKEHAQGLPMLCEDRHVGIRTAAAGARIGGPEKKGTPSKSSDAGIFAQIFYPSVIRLLAAAASGCKPTILVGRNPA